MSENAPEARNKDIKRFREHHTRKTFRRNIMENLFNNFLLPSDPFISSLRESIWIKNTSFMWRSETISYKNDDGNINNVEEKEDSVGNYDDEGVAEMHVE